MGKGCPQLMEARALSKVSTGKPCFAALRIQRMKSRPPCLAFFTGTDVRTNSSSARWMRGSCSATRRRVGCSGLGSSIGSDARQPRCRSDGTRPPTGAPSAPNSSDLHTRVTSEQRIMRNSPLSRFCQQVELAAAAEEEESAANCKRCATQAA